MELRKCDIEVSPYRKPAISVLMPVYNAERFVAEAVESVLGQTYREFEFLIVDDGSTDGSRGILEGFAARDRRVRLVSRPNAGLVRTLNEMLAMASGEYIARMDADDICEPTRLEKQVAFLEAQREHVVVGSRVLAIDSDGDPLCEMREGMGHEEVVAALLNGHGGSIICHPSVLARRSAMEAVGGYRAEALPAEDLEIFLRLSEVGKLEILGEVLLRYRVHATSISMTRRAEQLSKIVEIVNAARQRRGMTPLSAAEAGAGWEPQDTGTLHARWGWWALGAGHVATSRKHARKALMMKPWTSGTWRLAYCAMRGH